MSPRSARGIFLLLGLMTALEASAQLRWENPRIQHEAALGDESTKVAFRFTNAGTRPVTIVHVSSSCSCAVAALEKTTFAPGESGEINASFTFGGRTGHQEKHFTVTTDHDPQAPTTLSLHVRIPALIELSPLLLTWARDEAPTPKDVTVTAGSENEITLQEVRSSHPGFTFTITTEEEGRRYRVRITPPTTTSAVTATLRFTVEAIVGRPETRQVFAVVR